MPCIDNIVTLGLCPDDAASTSGFTLMQAPGMNVNTLADTASTAYISGINLAMQKKTLTLNQVRNDLMGVLQSNNVVTMMSDPVHKSSRFNTGKDMGTYGGERGITLHQTRRRGGLRKTFIKSIDLYPFASGDVVIKIYDGYVETQYEVTLTANQVNTVDVDYMLDQSTVKVLVSNAEVSFASAPLICHKGCGGQIPNDCAWVDGWDGTGAVKDEGYGINLNFYCKCDYTQIICDTPYMGEIIWLKWQINILDEQLRSDRFNNWTLYNRDELPGIIQGINGQYVAKWNEMMAGIFGILKTYSDECLNCRGVRWRVNV